ncbi:MAG: DUF2232 domain-containing protein [Pseudomonadota bacterium]
MPTLVSAGAGLVSSLLYATLLTGSLGAYLLAYLAPLPLFAAGLGIGVGGAAIAALTATLAAAVGGGFTFGLIFLIVNVAPALLVTRQALLNRRDGAGQVEWYPPGPLVAWLTGFAAAVLISLVLLVAGEPGGLEGFIRDFLDTGLRALAPAGTPPDAVTQFTTALARIFPGVVAVSWLVMIAINGALAQGLLVRFGRNRRPSPEVSDIELPSWMLGATAISAIGAFMPGLAGFLGGNLLLILGLAFTFAGLGVLHAIARNWRNRLMWLTAFYIFILVFGWPVVLVAALGLIEPWANLRRRFAGRLPRS